MEHTKKGKKNVIIVATTVFHVIVAIQIKKELLREDFVDLIIGDETPNMKLLTGRLQKIGIFRTVAFVHMDEYNKNKGKYQHYTPYLYAMKKYPDILSLFCSRVKYDIFLFPFFHHFHMNLYSCIKRFRNPSIRAYLYEEGTGIYSSIGAIYQSKLKETEDVSIYRMMKYGRLLREIRGILTFNPNMLQWGGGIPKIKIPYINRDDFQMKKMLNYVFGYNGEFKDLYDRRIIFFEEAKSEDKIKANDLAVVNQVAEIVGKDQILIKLHPRTSENRFAKYGFLTNRNTLIPWEVIFMNHDMTGKILISTASSSIIHPVIIFGERVKGVFLFKLVHTVLPPELMEHESFINEIIMKRYADCFYIPTTYGELKDILSKGTDQQALPPEF